MFAPLPSNFPRLENLVAAMEKSTVVAPPPIKSIGLRLRDIYAGARASNYEILSAPAIRRLPYAYWIAPEPPLYVIDGALVRRYWSSTLPEALTSGVRRARRWLTPLFFVYCEAFQPNDGEFLKFAMRIAYFVKRADGPFAKNLVELQEQLSFFIPSVVPTRLANHLLTHSDRLDQALASCLLWPGFMDTLLGSATFSAALGLADDRLRDREVITRIVEWANRLAAPVEKSIHRVRFAEGLLRPWQGRKPPDFVKSKLIETFIGRYGDPRGDARRDYQWRDVSPQAISVLMSWLAGDTMRGFMRILEDTADEIWRHRQKFWMAYYDSGYIEEAWVALGTDAHRAARRLTVGSNWMGCGRITSGATSNQSILLLKIGNLVFTEWSHNGSLRAFPDSRADAPKLYKKEYAGAELRSVISMDFHDGMNQEPQLRHWNSTGGAWQRRARDFIRKHTGIHLSDREIL